MVTLPRCPALWQLWDSPATVCVEETQHSSSLSVSRALCQGPEKICIPGRGEAAMGSNFCTWTQRGAAEGCQGRDGEQQHAAAWSRQCRRSGQGSPFWGVSMNICNVQSQGGTRAHSPVYRPHPNLLLILSRLSWADPGCII